MKNPIGQKRWAIAEGYIPSKSHGPEPEMTSHETCTALRSMPALITRRDELPKTSELDYLMIFHTVP